MISRVFITRKENRLTQKEVAKRIGMSERSYRLKESGEREFKISEGKKLAKLFNKSLDELFN